MSKAPALLKSPGIQDMVKESTLDGELLSVLKNISEFLKGIFNGMQSVTSFVSGNWQLLIVGAVSLVILSKRR